ncbi:uncharacterized protein E0L32_004845 [Thyridium curvatum]|uniref:Sister chromatid cohesion protein n=1 Tax=Thyridium curvatum TaxID=1093900 RepID=A0A507AW68_9PEZI|nr:uncharacterized protein E0L32_004845 [Thyridium curvatum]TPX15015.1 hypothetical protein E0L32_004845 [Thyridium curvatum]
MAHSRPAGQNGLPNGQASSAGSRAQSQKFSRPFTLQEALPYSPFTSIIPFESDIIPTPAIGSALPAHDISDAVPRQDYDALNQEAEASSTTSKKLEQSLEQVQQLLHPNKLTQYTFRHTPITSTQEAPTPNLAAGLPSFAKMVYTRASVAFRYPTPETPGQTSPNGQTTPKPRAKPKSPAARKSDPPRAAPANAATNKQAQAYNSANFEIIIPTKSETEAVNPNFGINPQVLEVPAKPKIEDTKIEPEALLSIPDVAAPNVAPAASQSNFTIELSAPVDFNKEEYQVVPDSPEAPENLSRRRHQNGYAEEQDAYGASLDQRQRADTAYQDMRRLFQEIFEAEQNLSGQANSSRLVVLTNDQESTLSAAASQKAHSAIKKAIDMGCFTAAPLDDLLHMQRLSEGSLRHAESLDVRIDESWGETELASWVQQLPEIDAGLKAARMALRLMGGGREDRQLYSEDLIQTALNLFKNVMDGIIVPVAEMRPVGPTEQVFRGLSSHKKLIVPIFTTCERLFSLLGTLVASIDLSETVINTLEFAASRLMFVENAHTERESLIGVQKFDVLRSVAMDMLSQIFLMNPVQRQGIFDDILTSLEKLPVGRLSARQFKLADGKSIQAVSALIMRLVQASSSKVDDGKARSRTRALQAVDEDGNAVEPGLGEELVGQAQATILSEEQAAIQHATAIQELQSAVEPLLETARRNASYVINFIVNRALKSTKSGDTPYRNLLDLFVEDFTTCLDSPDWPAAELLLRLLMMMMVKLVEGERSAAPAKNMALELLGVMVAAISRIRDLTRKTAGLLDTSEPLNGFLADMALEVLVRKPQAEQMCAWSGPYRADVEYLQERLKDDPHLTSAISYVAMDWASKICTGYDSFEDDREGRDQEMGRMAFRLRMMIEDQRWLSNEYRFGAISPSQAKMAHYVILARSQLCEAFNAILNLLLGSLSSDQATVRSKGLKSINQVMERDPSILDGDSVVVELILQCSHDSSAQVRDSALGLIGKSIEVRPALEEKMLPTVIQRFIDSGVGVRKRAMKLARSVYPRNHSKQIRSAIANGLLHRVQDPDEGVRELARQMVEEIWIFPFYSGEESAEYKTSLTDHVSLIVQSVKTGNITTVLDKVFQLILSPTSKTAKANFEVCRRLVASMFDLVNNPDSEDPSVPSGRDALQVLMILAKADAKLFTFEQIKLLKPYIASVGTSEDMAVSRAVVVIYCRVLPQLSSVHTQFLTDIRMSLMSATMTVSRNLLDEVMACLWIISTLTEVSTHLARLVNSGLVGITKIKAMIQKGAPMSNDMMRKFERYSLIVGMVGKHCDLDSHASFFKTSFPKWQGGPVSKLMVDVMLPFAKEPQPLIIRKAALDGVGLICQSNPRNYVSANVYTTFQEVFDGREPTLETMIMRSLKEFLTTEERRSELATEAAKAAKTATAGSDNKRELTVMGGTNYDDVASATTQRFLKDLTRIALAGIDDHAFLAVEVLGSINRQGLVHPKETGVTMITLETCPVTRISELAYHEHRALHEKHETVLEREYVKAIQSAFQYQRDIIKDTRGATTEPFVSKLHLLAEVLKISRSKNRQRFLEKLCTQVDFEPAKLSVREKMPSHVEFSRFIVENLAFFEYETVGEVQKTISTMEKIVHSTGAAVAHAIESEIFQVRIDSGAVGEDQGSSTAAAPPSVDPRRLRQLTASSMILTCLWEARSYLRRLYGLSSHRRESKGKGPPKDLAKAPIKVQGVTGDKFWDDSGLIMTALDSQERMLEHCRSFVELLNVDKEFKISEEDDEMDDDAATPSGDEDDPSHERGRKRKATGTPSGRKKRPRSSSQPRKRGRPRKNPVEEDVDAEFEEDVDWF